jgi:dTDP-4-dehydrorhamnose reductase
MTRILITGATGQVGQELKHTLQGLGELIVADRAHLDLAQPETIPDVLKAIQPQVIINPAAYTAVDKAETEPEIAHTVNAIAPQMLAKQAQQLNIPLIHISTDYVFDGRKNTPYLEEDATQPLGVYGQTKLLGEERVRQECDRHIIVRTAWVYSAYGKGNFVKTMLRLAKEREELRVVADQLGTPTWAAELAKAIAQLLPQVLTPDSQQPALQGIYHYTNSGVASWYDFAVAIIEEARQLRFPLQVQQIIPITTADYPTPAQRPAYSVLSNQKLSAVLKSPSPHWREGLRQMLSQLYTQTYESTHSFGR